MKKILVLSARILFVSIATFAQTKVFEKGYLFDVPTRKLSTYLISQGATKEDSTFAKTNNGFDVRKSNVDNMFYLNANSTNPALNKMPITVTTIPVEPMPTRSFSYNGNKFSRDTIIHFNSSDSLKNWKKH